jgi:hypothetical protein
MGISNISRTGGEPESKFLKGIALAAILSVAACASSTKRKDVGAGENPAAAANTAATADQPGQVYGPFPNASGPVPPSSGPADLVENPDRVVLVLGRGLTHGYAYVGVLRALRELKIPIHSIYATEFGALASALYFTQPNPNRIDWALLRFNEKNLGASSGKFSFHLSSPENDLDSRLREVFGERRIETTADRLHIELQDAKTGEALEAKTGDLWRAVRGALAGANGYDPIDVEGRPVRASARKLADEYRIARQNERYPVIVVSAGGPPTVLFRKLLEEQHATLLYVPLPGIDDLDLKKRNQAVFAGKNAVHKAATEILGLVGRKPE